MTLSLVSDRANYLELLAATVRAKHKCGADHWASVGVLEYCAQRLVWSGSVEVFDLSGHQGAARCYAWGEVPRIGECQFVTVLESCIVNSPQAAVKAWLASKSVTIHPVAAGKLAGSAFTWLGREQWASQNVPTNKSQVP